jgi:ubiquinone/menaquinone biosynthesis C-methylase UbiE
MSPILGKDAVQEHFDEIAKNYDYWKKKNWYYYSTIKSFIRRVVPERSRVLEIGCGTGEILASLNPSYGVGIDISAQMVKLATQKFPQHSFIHSPIEDLKLEEKFDYIVMVDVVDHVYDVMDVFKSVYRFCKPTTRVILTTINPWWDPILMLMEKIGAKMPEGPHNFIEKGNLTKILDLMDFSLSYSGYLLLFPKHIPVLSFLANAIGTRLWGLNKMSSVQYMIIEPRPQNTTDLHLGCSVIIPCYNEGGNIQEAIKRVPKMGRETEIVVVNDGSKDDTAQQVRALQNMYPNLKLVDYSPNRGKGKAVQAGFEASTQEIVMILDADMTVPPEELPRFFSPLNKGLCQFVNGTRMVYPMQSESMRTANLFGNKIFGLIMSFLTQQSLTDTLCGTKALYRKDLKRIKWGLDRWGDFDLLFGAAKMGSKIMEVPVHYMSRKAGQSKMKSFRHCLHLLRACLLGFRELVLFNEMNDVPSKS